jgi:hypothetical protein
MPLVSRGFSLPQDTLPVKWHIKFTEACKYALLRFLALQRFMDHDAVAQGWGSSAWAIRNAVLYDACLWSVDH